MTVSSSPSLSLSRAVLVALVLSTAVDGGSPQEKSPSRRGDFAVFSGGPGAGFGGTYSGLLRLTEVQKELGINEEQKQLIDDMQNDVRRLLSEGQNFNPQQFRALGDEERQKRWESFRKRREELSGKEAELLSVILAPEQVERLHQLRLQSEGVAALLRPEIAVRLDLGEEQQSKVRKTLQDLEAANRGLFREMGSMSQEQRQQLFAKMRENRDRAATDLLALLTPNQQATWQKMLGKKLDFVQQVFGTPSPMAGENRQPNASSKKKR